MTYGKNGITLSKLLLMAAILSGCSGQGGKNKASSSSISLDGAPNLFEKSSQLTKIKISSPYGSYRYKVGPKELTDCSDLAGYSAPELVTKEIEIDLGSFNDGEYQLCIVSQPDITESSDFTNGFHAHSWTQDTTPPSPPSTVNVEASDLSSLDLSWDEGGDADTGAIAFYMISIFKADGTQLSPFTKLNAGGSFSGLNLTEGEEYYFKIFSVDMAGNESPVYQSSPWTAVVISRPEDSDPSDENSGDSSSDTTFAEYSGNDCSFGAPIGTTCPSGAVFAGKIQNHLTDSRQSYLMTTPSNCTQSSTPNCDGQADILKLKWDSAGSTSCSAAPPLSLGYSERDGAINTPLILSEAGNTAQAAKFCAELSYAGYNDWYLPSMAELKESLMPNRLSLNLNNAFYWSSEKRNDCAYLTNPALTNVKSAHRENYFVRCVRNAGAVPQPLKVSPENGGQDFEVTLPSTTSPWQTVTFKNTANTTSGTLDVKLISGSDFFEIGDDTCTGSQLSKDGTCTVQVRFNNKNSISTFAKGKLEVTNEPMSPAVHELHGVALTTLDAVPPVDGSVVLLNGVKVYLWTVIERLQNVQVRKYWTMITPSGCTDSQNPNCSGFQPDFVKKAGKLEGNDYPDGFNIVDFITYQGRYPVDYQELKTPAPAAAYCGLMNYGGKSDWSLINNAFTGTQIGPKLNLNVSEYYRFRNPVNLGRYSNGGSTAIGGGTLFVEGEGQADEHFVRCQRYIVEQELSMSPLVADQILLTRPETTSEWVTFTITNSDTESHQIYSPTLTGTIEIDTENDGCLNKSLQPNETCQFQVRYNGPSTVGTKNVSIDYDFFGGTFSRRLTVKIQ